MSRVVITGMDAITHLGIGHEALNMGFFSREKSQPETWVSSENQIELKGYRIDDKVENFKNLLSPFNTRNMDRFAKINVATIALGLQNANLTPNQLEKTGFIMSTIYGPWESTNRYTKELVKSGPTSVSPRLFPNTVVNSAQGHVCISFQIKGPTSTLAGQSAIPYAVSLIQKGAADRVIVAGADEANENVMEAFNQLGSPITFGEGVGVLILESAESAIERQAHIYGEIGDYALGCEPSMNLWFEEGNPDSAIYEELLSGISLSDSPNELAIISAANGSEVVATIEGRLQQELEKSGKKLQMHYPKEKYGETFGASSVLSTINAIHLLNNHEGCEEALVLSNEIGGNHMALTLKKWQV